MKITALLLITTILQASANGFSQKITFSATNAPLQEVFKAIEKQTGYFFLYQDELLASAEKIDINVKDAPLDEVLAICFKHQPLDYKIFDKNIVVRKKENILPTPALEVKGKVVNEKGEPLIGATILIKGSSHSVESDANGEFILHDVGINAVLMVSNVGYESQEIKLDKNTEHLFVRLRISVSKLDEVQVIAYGTVTKKMNTGSISTVKAADIEKQPVANPLAALEGRVPGLQITQQSGLPGAAFTVQLRGRNSIRANASNPLYIIDGVPFTSTPLASTPAQQIIPSSNPLGNINPADIASIEVLKDADATAIYGSRGANGVILITTKKGMPGKTKADFGIYTGFGKVTRTMQLLNSKQWMEMRHEAVINDSTSPQVFDHDLNGDWDTTRNTDWQKLLIGGTAKITDIHAAISGGTINSQFMLGGTFHRETTVFPGNFSDQKGFGYFNFNHASENRKLKISFAASYAYDGNNLLRQDLTGTAISLSPVAPAVYDSSGKLNWQRSTWTNPFSLLGKKYKGTTNTFLANAIFDYEIFQGMELRASLGYTNMNIAELATNPISSNNPAQAKFGSATFSSNSIATWIAEPQAEYKKSMGKSKLDVIAGMTFQQNIRQGQTLLGSNYTSDALIENIQAAGSIRALNSVYSQYRYDALFGRIFFSHADKYLINLTARRDGSSRFGSSMQFANFGAAGIGWILSNEDFMKKNIPVLSFAKLRGSYGITGNDQIPDYGFLDTYSATSYAYQGGSGLIPTQLVNPYFAWETNKKLELALETGFFKDRIFFQAEWYSNKSSNQLVGYSLPAVTGFQFVQANLPAAVKNSGIEIELNAEIIRTKNLSWKTYFNITVPGNKLLSYPGIEGSAYQYTYKVGQPLYIQNKFQYTGVDPQLGVYTFQSIANGKPTLDPVYPDDLQFRKTIAQQYYGGLQNSISFQGFQLDIFFQFVKQTGFNYLYSFGLPGGFFSGNQPSLVTGRWQKPGDITSIQKFSTGAGIASSSYDYSKFNGDNTISDASFIRLKNISLSWQIDPKWAKGISDGKIFVRAQNLLTITHYLGMDPENQNINSRLPPLRIIIIGIQATF